MLIFYLNMLDCEEDRLKLEDIYKRYYSLMFKTALFYTNDTYYAECAVSDALLSMTRHVKKIRTDNEDSLKSFIYVTVKNASYSTLRKNRASSHMLNIDDFYGIASETNVETALEASDNYKKIVECIYRLPDIYKDALFLKYIHGLSTKEISQILKINYSTVRVRLRRGIKILKDLIAETESK